MWTSGRAPKSECSSPSDRRPHLLTGVPPRSASLPQALLGPHSTRGGLSPAGWDDERLGLGDAPAGRQLLTEHPQGRGLRLRAVLRLCQRFPRSGCALLGGKDTAGTHTLPGSPPGLCGIVQASSGLEVPACGHTCTRPWGAAELT